MASDEYVALLKQGVAAWNEWHPDTRPDLSEANLSKADLSKADLSKADLSKACLGEANLNRCGHLHSI